MKFMTPDDERTLLAFDFFYRFGRIEYALKEQGYVKPRRYDNSAQVGWDLFEKKFAAEYKLSVEAAILCASPPQVQVVFASTETGWAPLDLDSYGSDLGKLIAVLKTMRNNLFHGGKKGPKGWSDQARIPELLTGGMVVIEQLVDLGGLSADYEMP